MYSSTIGDESLLYDHVRDGVKKNSKMILIEHAATATLKFGFYPREGDYPVVLDNIIVVLTMKIVRFVYQVNIQKFFPGSGSLLRKSWFTATSTSTIVFLDGEFKKQIARPNRIEQHKAITRLSL